MAAYQCLNCEQIEKSDDQCCGQPNLFCINNMPGEIKRLRNALDKVGETSGIKYEMTFDEWWNNHGRYNAGKLKKNERIRELMQLSHEVGREIIHTYPPQLEGKALIDTIKDAFFAGFTSVQTYNDTVLTGVEEAWEIYKVELPASIKK